MAKKKVSNSHSEKPSQKPEEIVKPHQQVPAAAMDSEATEKIESLKSLNHMLLKEAHERRQQVDSLVLAKGSLESELTESNSEKSALRSELTQLSERAARLELERSVVSVFVAEQAEQKTEAVERRMMGLEREMTELKSVISEKECEIGRLNVELSEIEGVLGNEREVSKRVSVERDELKGKLGLQIEEGKGLRVRLVEAETRKREIEREIGELQVAYNGVVGDKKEREMTIESITREKGLMERSLVESNKLIEEMKEKLGSIVREKEGIEKEKNVEMVKRKELENAVTELNEIVVNLRNEEEKLRSNVVELEKKCVEGGERQKDMRREIDELVEERKSSEKSVELLMNEKNTIGRDLGEKMKELEGERRKLEGLVNENNVLVEAKGRLEAEVVELQNQVAGLKGVVLKLEESSRVEVEKIKNLESEVGEFRSKLEQVKVERDEMGVSLGEEKKNGVRLKEKIVELEKKVEERLKAVEEAKAKNAAIFAEKMELESRCGMLKKEITSLENTLAEARSGFDSMKGRVESAEAILKETAAFCSKGEEIKKFGEMEMIKKAFESKESKVENMKKQLELFQKSVEEANKKKGFWAVLSSATTLLAAVSVAYAARAH